MMFAALTMISVGKAAAEIITEVRRQFREVPGLRPPKCTGGLQVLCPGRARVQALLPDVALRYDPQEEWL